MKSSLCLALLTAALTITASGAPAPGAPGKLVVTVTNDLAAARPAETIAVPFAQIRSLLDPAHANPAQYWNTTRNIPLVRFDNLLVKDAAGHVIPSQVTNLDTKGGRNYEYDDLLFQHDFAAGEKTATFTIEAVEGQVPPYPAKVYGRFVPDRLDDFAWENDLIAHRIYGPALELPSAGPDRMPVGGSGIDVWNKRFPYFVIDRWYGKDHNALHAETGEGLDMYETGQARGEGGLGIWDGQALHVSRNFRTWKVLANGPLRLVFELGYEPWDAGNGVQISEVKRFTMDAGHYLDQVQSTFTFTGADELTVGIGLTMHSNRGETTSITPTTDEKNFWETLWEVYPANGETGVGVLLAPNSTFAGFAQSQANLPASPGLRPDKLILAKVKSGVPLVYYSGAAWNQLGPVTTNDQWTAYVGGWAQRLRSPVKVDVALAGAK
jgi:hypothetical protein